MFNKEVPYSNKIGYQFTPAVTKRDIKHRFLW